MGTKHLTADPIFSAQLASTFGRVVELIELMRRYRAVFVSNCCACFGCCMTNGFGGEPAVEEIAEKLEKLVTQVKANFKLDIQIGGVNRVTVREQRHDGRGKRGQRCGCGSSDAVSDGGSGGGGGGAHT